MVKSKRILSLFLSVLMILSITALAVTPATVSAVSKRSKVVKKLTKKKWYLSKMYNNGEPSSPGSGVKYGGAQIKFTKKKKFSCNIGLIYGCSGKYTVSKKGKVTLKVKKQWDGAGYGKVRKRNIKIKISKSFKTISFKAPYEYGTYKFYFKR